MKKRGADSVFAWMGRSICGWIRPKDRRLRNGLLPFRSHLEEVIKNYGEERFAKQIARAIIAARVRQPIVTTHQLAAIVATAVRSRERENKQNPATRTFQAIRIYLNQELEKLSLALPKCVEMLNSGGRLVVISFHSLEDRTVKRFMRESANPTDCRGPAVACKRGAALSQP